MPKDVLKNGELLSKLMEAAQQRLSGAEPYTTKTEVIL